MQAIKYKKKNIFYTDKGKGKTIVLIHGFTETLEIWNRFTKKLSKKYRVIAIDLPGHGNSECLENVHTMDLMTDMIFGVLKKLKVMKCLMVGHSMGGYVTLSFAAKYPEKLKGFSLFHSHCFADSPAEQENRNRTIAVVNQDKFTYLAQFIPSLFPVDVHKKFSKDIELLIRRASKMEKKGVVAALEGMKIRKDQSEVLSKTKLPVLFILGQKDSKAPMARLWEMIALPALSETLLLRECGHMGYIEYPEETCEAIATFAKRIL
ncbi:MAG: alpha/beta hydrolase [Bacteroidales bacterium]|nr:alpha/beta hydrolase [Bacteroidales bacterium]